jgi:hypothetical protein
MSAIKNSIRKILTDEEIEEAALKQKEEANDDDFEYYELHLNKSDKFKCNVHVNVKNKISAANNGLPEPTISKEQMYRLKQLKIQEKQKMKKTEAAAAAAAIQSKEKNTSQKDKLALAAAPAPAPASAPAPAAAMPLMEEDITKKNSVCDDWEDLF